jgi:hypothetical protein
MLSLTNKLLEKLTLLTIGLILVAFRDFLAKIRLLANLFVQEITNRDCLPVEILTQSKSSLLPSTARGTNQENSAS